MNGAQQYRAMKTESASPHQLIQMLLDTLLLRIDQAVESIEMGNIERKAEYINRALLILSGLQEALDMEKGGELSENLEAIYVFARTEILDGSHRNCTETLKKIKMPIMTIRDSWQEIATQCID